MTRSVFTAIALLWAVNATASTIVDFKQAPLESLEEYDDGAWAGGQFDYQGFRVSSDTVSGFYLPTLNSNFGAVGCAAFSEPNYCTGLVIDALHVPGRSTDTEGNAIFDFYAFEASVFLDSYELTVTGWSNVNGSYSQTFQINNSDTYFIAGGGWEDVSSITFEALSVPIIQSITVSEVPIPAALWLFGSALAGLGWMRRKQTV